MLIDFYRLVRPVGAGLERRFATRPDLTAEAARMTGDNIPMALLGWVAGCTMIWSSLFTVGNFLYGRTATAFVLLGIFAISAVGPRVCRAAVVGGGPD